MAHGSKEPRMLGVKEPLQQMIWHAPWPLSSAMCRSYLQPQPSTVGTDLLTAASLGEFSGEAGTLGFCSES